MNNRIRELVKQAGINLTPAQFSGVLEDEVSEFDLEKFAELIVQECADLCNRFQARNVGMQPAECAGAIRKMFGIKE